jgi:hypothetical protein
MLSLAACIGLAPYAFGQKSPNPLGALWDAIYDLQRHDDGLQAQIDELKADREALSEKPSSLVADPMVDVDVAVGTSGELGILLHVYNEGPDRAAGVKLTMFYKMTAMQLDNISGEGCRDLSRGIIQCDLGTIEAGSDSTVSIDARQIDAEPSTLTVDLSSITMDADPSNNRYVGQIATSLAEPVNDGDKDVSDENPPEPEEKPVEDQDDGVAGNAGNQTSDQSDESTSDGNDSGTTDPQDSDEQSGDDTSSDSSSDTNDSKSDSSSDEGKGSGGDDGDPTTQPSNEQTSDG